MRDGAVFLHVLAVVDREPAARRQTQRSHVEDRHRAGADDGTRGGDADELAALERLDGVAEDLGVAAGVLIAQDDDRLVPGDVDLAIERVPRAGR